MPAVKKSIFGVQNYRQSQMARKKFKSLKLRGKDEVFQFFLVIRNNIAFLQEQQIHDKLVVKKDPRKKC